MSSHKYRKYQEFTVGRLSSPHLQQAESSSAPAEIIAKQGKDKDINQIYWLSSRLYIQFSLVTFPSSLCTCTILVVKATVRAMLDPTTPVPNVTWGAQEGSVSTPRRDISFYISHAMLHLSACMCTVSSLTSFKVLEHSQSPFLVHICKRLFAQSDLLI